MSQNAAEAYILREIEDIDSKIKELQFARGALQGVLARIRQSARPEFGKHRRNSAERILVETRIIEELNRSLRPLSSARLYKAAKTVLSDLKEGTFRSYLHRMKIRGVVANPNAVSGMWRLVFLPQTSAPPATDAAANTHTTDLTSTHEPMHPPTS